MAKITISRKWDLRAALIPYNVFVDGEFVGRLKNGKSLSREVERRESYIVGMGDFFGENRMITDNSSDEIRVALVMRGGWAKQCFQEFMLIDDSGALRALPNPFDKLRAAYVKSADLCVVSAKERNLLLCAEFYLDFADGLDELAFNEKLNDMLAAAREIGATRVLDAYERTVNAHLSGVALPLTDDEIDSETEAKLLKASEMASESFDTERLSHDMYRAMARYIGGIS